MEDFNIDDFSEGEELNPSAYNPEDYPTKETVLDFIALNCNEPPVNIDLMELSVNGSVNVTLWKCIFKVSIFLPLI